MVFPAGLEIVRHVEEVEDFAHDEVDDVVDGLGKQVEAGVGGAEGGAGEGQGLHVPNIDEAQGHLAVADDEGSAFFQGDHRRPAEQIAAAAGGHRPQTGGRAGENDHSVVQEAAGGDHRADVLVRMEDEAFGAGLGGGRGGGEGRVEVWAECFQREGLDLGFVEEQALAVVADDEVDLVATDEECLKQAEGVARARGTGDSDDESAA